MIFLTTILFQVEMETVYEEYNRARENSDRQIYQFMMENILQKEFLSLRYGKIPNFRLFYYLVSG